MIYGDKNKQIRSKRLIDPLGFRADSVAFLLRDAIQAALFRESPDLQHTGADPFVVSAGGGNARNGGKRGTAWGGEKKLHRIFDEGEDELGVMRGDIGEGDAGVNDGGGDLPLSAKQLVEREHQVTLGISVDK